MDINVTSPWPPIIIIFILAIAALFTLTEYSLVKVRPTELKELKPTRKVKNALKMLDNLTEYLSTAQVGITITSLILGWIGEEYITDVILYFHLLPAQVAKDLSSVIGILIFTFLHAVFTDLVPKNIAIDKPVKVLLFIVDMTRFFHIVFFPLIWIFDRVAIGVTKMLGFSAHPDEDIYSENEILSLSIPLSKDIPSI